MGIFALLLYIPHWNRSNNRELKNYARDLLSRNTAPCTKNAITQIEIIVEAELRDRGFDCSVSQFEHYLGSIFVNESEKKPMAKLQERKDLANRDVALYFATMFEAGHFESIPMPEFGYEPPVVKQVLTGSPEKLMEGASKLAKEHTLPKPEIRFGPKQKDKFIGGGIVIGDD